jgi:hypothetical protein
MSPEARERSFDALATGLASGSISRGRALKLMGAALIGGTLASLGIGGAAADPPGCKRNGKSCKNNEQCCRKNCDSSSGTCECIPDCEPCTEDRQCCRDGTGVCLPVIGGGSVCARDSCL